MFKFQQKRNGWIVAEYMMVIVLSVILLGAAVYKAPSILNGSKSSNAHSTLAVFGAAISEYKVEIGSYPDNLNDLTVKTYNYGPWVKKIIKDPWGNEYQYIHDDDGYAVFSFGSDNKNSGSTINKIAVGDIGFIGK